MRQVTSYWEMAASFVLHGALSEELFVDCNTEPFFLYARFLPYLPEIRRRMPGFLAKTEKVVERSTVAKARVDAMVQRLAARVAEPEPLD